MGNFNVILPRFGYNIVTDPSFNRDTLDWTTHFTSSFVLSSVESLYGAQSMKATRGAGETVVGINYPMTISGTPAYYRVSVWIYVPSDETVPTPTIKIRDTAWSTVYHTSNSTGGKTDRWVELKVGFVPDGGWSGFEIAIESETGASSNAVFYLDGFMVERHYSEVDEKFSTYIDGRQPGCFWRGAEDDSSSQRDTGSRDGGAVYNLEDDLGLIVEFVQGAGFPTVNNQLTKTPLIDGMNFETAAIGESTMQLVGTVVGSDLENLHSLRSALIEALRPENDPILIRYTGAEINKEAKFRYVDGLQFGKGASFAETIKIKLVNVDSYWYQVGNRYEEGDVLIKVVGHGGVLQDEGPWHALGLSHGSHDLTTPIDIKKILYDKRSGLIYVAGSFLDWKKGNLTNADNIVSFNSYTGEWAQLGGASALNGEVLDMILRPEGGIYVSGNFTNAGGEASADYVAYWTGNSWQPVRGGITGKVASMTVGKDSFLYVSGNFTTLADDAAAKYLARYNSNTSLWEHVHSNTTITTYASKLATDANGDIWYAGAFEITISAATERIVMRISDDEVYPVGEVATSLTGVIVNDLLLENGGKAFLIGTGFGVGDGAAIFWNGTAWVGLGSGLANNSLPNSPDVICTSISKAEDRWLITGEFDESGGIKHDAKSAYWNGSSWTPLPLLLEDDEVSVGAMIPLKTGSLAIDRPFLGIPFDPTASANDAYGPDLTRISVSGTARAYPTFRIYNSGLYESVYTVSSIENMETGAIINLNYPLIAGEEIDVIIRPGHCTIVSSVFGESVAYLPTSKTIDFFFVPGRSNDIALFAGAIASPVTFVVSWKNTFWGVD